ncbi:MAG: penicillin acylase family protein [Bacteroidota bacterium]
MKFLKRLGFGLLLFFAVLALAVFFFLQSKSPDLEGQLVLQGLSAEVEVYFDEYGIPHIYAQNETDAQYALGYVHAQDRLFQMELLRRLSRGELAEILGPDLIENDRFFRTMGILESATAAQAAFDAKTEHDPMKLAALAYHKGVNAFIEQGAAPIEFTILGIEARPFTLEDTYAIYGYMAFSFAQAFRTDPLLTRIYQKLGEKYFDDLDTQWNPSATKIPVWGRAKKDSAAMPASMTALMDRLPVPPFIGSNGWVIGPKKTKNGQVIFSNDTHMGYAQPAVWYEAHLEYPGHRFYGYYLAGVPFPVLGNNHHHAIGLTMLENDDIDFYVEEYKTGDSTQVRFGETYEPLSIRKEQILVKDGEPIQFEVKTSRHGPILNEALEDISITTDQPVAMWWVYHQFPNKSLELSYQMAHATSMEEVRDAVSLGHAPGLNVMYGDVDGNIAWYALAKLPIRPDHVHSKLLLDGASGADEILGYTPFTENPQSENPAVGYLYSANNQPDTVAGRLHPGYYIPRDRASRIVEILDSKSDWDVDAVKEMILDVQSPVMQEVRDVFVAAIDPASLTSEQERQALEILTNWNGDNQLEQLGPTIFTKMLYESLAGIMADELGEEDFGTMLRTHLFKRSFPYLFANERSVWWDDKNTEATENRGQILTAAFQRSVAALSQQLGDDPQAWQWQKVHTLEHGHALGAVEALKPWFNVGPFPVPGNTEVINNLQFTLNKEGTYEVGGGPAKRRIIDFADWEHSWNCSPTGQSGNPMSPHYSDQAEMFAKGEFRLQKMKAEEIKTAESRKLVFSPK